MSEDACFNEVAEFMACDEGRRFLQGIRDHLSGHTINRVDFVNNGEGVTTILRLSSGQCYAFNDEELWLETLREQFSGLFRELNQHNEKGPGHG